MEKNYSKNPTDSIPVVSMRGIIKTFPHVTANKNIDFDIYKGEVHALLGENGAGKSTLMKILYGFYHADHGEIRLDNEVVNIESPKDARRLCIGMVFQNHSLIPSFSVAENIALFLPGLKNIYNIREVKKVITEVSERYGFSLDPDALVSDISIGLQQKVEILKLILAEARFLIFDEPTRVLAPHEIEGLFNIFKSLQQDGYSIVFITHKLDEVIQCADRITVLRKGAVASSILNENLNKKDLVDLMFEKKPVELKHHHRIPDSKRQKTVLELKDIETDSDANSVKLKGFNLYILEGEIVGVAGISGNGQMELGDLVLGTNKIINGQKIILNENATKWTVEKIRKHAVAFIPENPYRFSSIPNMTIIENMVLGSIWRYSVAGGLALDWKTAEQDLTSSYEEILRADIPLSSQRMEILSGGNQQKVIVAREMVHSPKLIIALYPTMGLDESTTMAVRQSLIMACEKGAGVLLISEDLDELFSMSDRLIVLYKGENKGEFIPENTNQYEIGLLMTGLKSYA